MRMENLMRKQIILVSMSTPYLFCLSPVIRGQQKNGDEHEQFRRLENEKDVQEQLRRLMPPEERRVVKIFELKYADANRIKDLFSVFPAKLSPDSALKVIGVNGTASTV